MHQVIELYIHNDRNIPEHFVSFVLFSCIGYTQLRLQWRPRQVRYCFKNSYIIRCVMNFWKKEIICFSFEIIMGQTWQGQTVISNTHEYYLTHSMMMIWLRTNIHSRWSTGNGRTGNSKLIFPHIVTNKASQSSQQTTTSDTFPTEYAQYQNISVGILK